MSNILYLGLEVSEKYKNAHVIHYPIIKIIPRPKDSQCIKDVFENFHKYTHIIFTSKSAVTIFFEYAPFFKITISSIQNKKIIAIGKKTAEKIMNSGVIVWKIAPDETAEGLTDCLGNIELQNSYIAWPHSALSRPLIKNWLQSKGIKHTASIFYDTVPNTPKPYPDLEKFDEIVFTSPSTVDAFIDIYRLVPENKKLSCIGPITEKHLMLAKINVIDKNEN